MSLLSTPQWDQDRIQGLFLGHALGDAMGAPYEFVYNKKQEITDLITLQQRHRSQWQGTRMSALGQVTDDTEMSLALYSCLLEHNRYNKNEVILSYLKWCNHSNTFLGKNTRALMKGVKTVRGYTSRFQKQDLSNMESNGCLMRAAPLVLLSQQSSFQEDVYTDVNLTNPNETCRECVWLYVQILRDLLNDVDPILIFEKYQNQVQTESVQIAFKDALEGNNRNLNGKDKGWVVHSFYCALYVLVNLKGNTYHELMMELLSWSGDTDTNMAIAGAFVGAFYGLKRLKDHEITGKNLEIILTCDPNNGAFPRNAVYHPQTYLQ